MTSIQDRINAAITKAGLHNTSIDFNEFERHGNIYVYTTSIPFPDFLNSSDKIDIDMVRRKLKAAVKYMNEWISDDVAYVYDDTFFLPDSTMPISFHCGYQVKLHIYYHNSRKVQEAVQLKLQLGV